MRFVSILFPICSCDSREGLRVVPSFSTWATRKISPSKLLNYIHRANHWMEVSTLEAEEAGDVYVDGGQTIRSFMERGLISEITITTTPVILGRGFPLFGELDWSSRLTLLSVVVLEDGMVMCKYGLDTRGE